MNLTLVIALLLMAAPAWGQTCTPHTDVPNFTPGQPAPLTCDTHGNLNVNSGTTAKANASAPSVGEGTTNPLSTDLADNLRMTLGTLLSGENQGSSQATSFLATSGAVVRTTVIATGVTTNTTSAAVTIPAGTKIFYGTVTGTGAMTQTQTIYGSPDNTANTANSAVVCTLTISASSPAADGCPPTTVNFPFYFVVTTNTTGTNASGVINAYY